MKKMIVRIINNGEYDAKKKNEFLFKNNSRNVNQINRNGYTKNNVLLKK